MSDWEKIRGISLTKEGLYPIHNIENAGEILKNKKDDKSRLFAALTSAGGSLVVGTLLVIWGIPDFQVWHLAWAFVLTLVTIGFLLILAGFYVEFRRRE